MTTDPERLIHAAGSPEARLLASALAEPPPADLLARTLAAVSAAAPAAGAAAGAVAAKSAGAAGGGILGSAAVGALAGVLVVGGYGLVTSRDEARSPSAAISAPAALTPSGARERPTAIPAPAASLQAPPPAGEATLPASAPVPSAARPTALAAEIELLDEASRALGVGNPARARALLDRYAREIPHGQLGREAAKLRAEVLASLRDGGDPERTIP